MKCLYDLIFFQFSDQQESTSNTSHKRKRFSANEEAQDLVEIERQRLEVQNNFVLNINEIVNVKLLNKV